MTSFAYGRIALYLAVLAVLALPLGVYIHKVMESVASPLSLLFRPVECAPMSWSAYTLRLIVFNAVGALFLYAIQRWQGWLPLNPAHFGGVSPDSAFNTAVSFASNTSWQSYAGETTLSYLTQMLGIKRQVIPRHEHRAAQAGSALPAAVHQQKRDDHPLHLHRHSFELRSLGAPIAAAQNPAAKSIRGIIKDVVLVGAQTQAEVEFTANNPGATLFHCHQQNHMDLGFMMLFNYA
jgi:FtsP/CotA-like multicopper oxidase with cupredoxin domain